MGGHDYFQYGAPGRPLSRGCTVMEERVAMKGNLETVALTNPLRYRKKPAWPVGRTCMATHGKQREEYTQDVREIKKGQMVKDFVSHGKEFQFNSITNNLFGLMDEKGHYHQVITNVLK